MGSFTKQNNLCYLESSSSNLASSNIYKRRNFLRNFYGILSLQLLLTVIAGFWAYFEELKSGLKDHTWVELVCSLLCIVLIFALYIRRHKSPISLFLFVVYTFLGPWMVGVFVPSYEVVSIIESLVLTTVIVVCITLSTLQSKRDFSKYITLKMTGLCVVVGAVILNMLCDRKDIKLPRSWVMTVLFSLLIFNDTHKMIKKTSTEECTFTSKYLYWYILLVFWNILIIFGEGRN
ncbi:Protein lifeguard 4 [Armadillidium vulgare]|nr:Protein lifeguard 4 [Armadillidium vulgare]